MLRYKTGKCLLGFLLILAIVSGCGNPQKKISRNLDKAREARQEGDVNQAITLLSEINEDFPGNADILEALGLAYEEEPDPFAAAIHLQQAVEADPTRTYLLKSVAQNYAAVGDDSSARTSYERYLDDFPSDGEATMALADLYREANQTESAIDAYLEGFELLNRPLRGEEAVTMGDLFYQLGNYPQAESYYQVALESGDLSELPALFGLLRINVANTNWSVTQRIVQRLDEEYPGALDTSELYTVREDIANWREARDKFEREQKNQELAARRQMEVNTPADTEQPPTRPPQDEETEQSPPTRESDTGDERIETADTETGDTPDTGESSGDTEETRGKLNAIADANTLEIFPEDLNTAPPPPAGPAADIQRARELRLDGVYSESVRLLWNVLGNHPGSAEAWFELSNAYLANNEPAAAETASLEAMRLDSTNPDYVLHHLDVIRKSRGRSAVIRELRMAHERFPNNPEILFELARGYEELASDPRNAAYIYNRFLDDYPNHPLAPEVRTKLRRIGN